MQWFFDHIYNDNNQHLSTEVGLRQVFRIQRTYYYNNIEAKIWFLRKFIGKLSLIFYPYKKSPQFLPSFLNGNMNTLHSFVQKLTDNNLRVYSWELFRKLKYKQFLSALISIFWPQTCLLIQYYIIYLFNCGNSSIFIDVLW